jgi:hypothetical protein
MRGSAAFRAAVAPGGVLAGPWVRNELWRRARAVPSLDLRFAENKSLVDATTGQNLVTFTRASSGTFVGSDGLIKTATTNEARFDHNPTTGESLGLLVEESRTNLLLRSEELGDAAWTTAAATVTSNTGVAPDGSSTADTITSSGTAVISQAVTKAASAITYTGSLFVKGTITALSFSIDDGATNNRGRVVFNLSTGATSSTSNDGTFTGTSGTITSFLNGWYRLAITTTTNSTTSVRLRTFWTGSGTSIDAWGAQLEAGAFPTSYIPTTTATVTRSADVASITGTNFSSWYRQDEGTVFASARTNATHGGVNSFPRIHAISDGTNDNVIQNYYRVLSGYTDAGYGVTTLTVAQASFDTNNERNGQSLSTAYANNDFAFAINGSLVSTDNTGTVPTVSQLRLGARGTGLGPLNGTIRRLTYWTRRLSDSTLQEVTR